MQAASHAKAPFQPSHSAIIVFVIIAKKVQEAMKREHSKLNLERVTRSDRLTGRNSRSNHDIAERPRLAGGE